MLNLLNPTWLFAIAALSIPVIIHLWNIRPGKTLKVGSISLMSEASRKSSRSFNLLDVVLLLLRCLLLALLAVLLAGPLWVKQIKTEKVKGWVLIPKENLNEAYTKFKPQVDSLAKAGYELHQFDRGFEKVSPEVVAQLHSKTLKDSIAGKAQKYWPLLTELNSLVPNSLPVYVFTANTFSHFTGTRPEVGLNLHWRTYIPADSTNTWIQSAALTQQGDHIKITEGKSSPAGTAFTYNNVQATEQRSSAYQINFNNGQPSVNLKGDTVKKAAAVDTSTLRIAIYCDKNNTDDARYLEAALTAVKQFTDRKMVIQTNTGDVRVKSDWIFWLRERQIPADLTATNMFEYEAGKPETIQSQIIFPGEITTALYKRVAAIPPVSSILWQDGFGNPVLSGEEGVGSMAYHFYGRFNPAWNDLVWSDDFPKVMLNLILNKPLPITHDYRTIANDQLMPSVSASDTHTVQNKLTDITDLSKAFWLALALIFLIERWLAHQTKPVENYG